MNKLQKYELCDLILHLPTLLKLQTDIFFYLKSIIAMINNVLQETTVVELGQQIKLFN